MMRTPGSGWGWLVAATVLCGCLEHRGAYLAPMDAIAPTVVSSSPVPITGSIPVVPRATKFSVTFSEVMSAKSLMGGIQLFRGNTPLELTLTVPTPTGLEDGIERGDVPYTVGYEVNPPLLDANTRHTLVYSTLLTDEQGNALEQEIRLTFTSGM